MSTFLQEATDDATFLSTQWGADSAGALTGVHFIGEPTDRGWVHHPVKTVTEALDKAQAISNAGRNAYFACSEYLTVDSRKGDNATHARSFWLDLDCGEAKAAVGNGYTTKREAADALARFCTVNGLPNPTALLDSGNGLHVYWALDTDVPNEDWRAYGALLKALTKKHGLLADPARTSDIASVLRVPGTLNQKDPANPKPVKVKYAGKPIEWRVFKAALEAASGGEAKPNNTALTGGLVKDYPPMPETQENVAKVRGMLAAVPADCDRETWRNICWAVQSLGWAGGVALVREWSMTA